MMICECGGFTTMPGNYASPERTSKAEVCMQAILDYEACTTDLGVYNGAKERIALYMPKKQCLLVDVNKAKRLNLIPCQSK